MCMYVCACLHHGPLHKAHVGAHIFCRMGTLNNYIDADPQWRSTGAMGTEGFEGATPSDDVPESWGVDLGRHIANRGRQKGAPHLGALKSG